MKKEYNFILLFVDIQSQHDFVEKLLFFIELSWHLGPKQIDSKCEDLFWDSKFCSIDLFVYSYANTTVFFLFFFLTVTKTCRRS